MSAMPLIQQKQPLPSVNQCSKHLRRLVMPIALALGGILIGVITILAGGVFGLLAALAFNMGLVIYLKDKWVTRILAAAMCAIIIAVSLAVLLPVAIPAVVPLMGFACTFSVTFASIRGLGHS